MFKRALCQTLLLLSSCWAIQANATDDPDTFIMPMPDARELFRSAANLNAQNPVSLLVSVVKNSNYPENVTTFNNSSANFVNNPVQAVSNLLTGNNVGVGLSVHF